MTDDELRLIVRETIARHLGGAAAPEPALELHPRVAADRRHASAMLFQLARGSESGGDCLIEPTVKCAHCGFCQTYGH